MLQLKGLNDIVKCTVEFDTYVPFKIKFGDWDILKEGTTYWRTGDLKKSLLQIGIGEISGTLRTATLTIAKDIKVIDVSKTICEEIESGIPVFDINGDVKNNKYDFIADFKVIIGNNFIRVDIEKVQEELKLISTDRVEIGINKDNNLSNISINNLTFNELATIKKALLL